MNFQSKRQWGLKRLAAVMIVLTLAVVFQLTVNSKEAVADDNATQGIPVYRLYTPVNGEHLYTTDQNEVSVLTGRYNWVYEGIGWLAPAEGKPVYRLYNAILNNHLYTTDTNEVKVLTTKHGWTLDNKGKALFYSGGSMGIYRLYNEGLKGMHLLTIDSNEYKVLPSHGWQQEGTKLYCLGKASGSKLIPNNDAFVDEVIKLVNVERKKAGLSELKKNKELCTAANARANEITKVFAHERPDGTSCFTVFSEYNISYMSAGENIAMGQSTPSEVVTAWMNSPGHKANILGEKFKEIGIGAIYYDGLYHWVQLFIG